MLPPVSIIILTEHIQFHRKSIKQLAITREVEQMQNWLTAMNHPRRCTEKLHKCKQCSSAWKMQIYKYICVVCDYLWARCIIYEPFFLLSGEPTQHKAYLDFCVWEIDVQSLLTLFMAFHLHIMEKFVFGVWRTYNNSALKCCRDAHFKWR